MRVGCMEEMVLVGESGGGRANAGALINLEVEYLDRLSERCRGFSIRYVVYALI